MARKIWVTSSVTFSVLAFLIFLLPNPALAQAKPIVLKYADPSKAGTARTDAVKDTFLEIEKRSGGKIKHEFYWAESLIKAKDTPDALKAGTCDVAGAPNMVYQPARFPLWQFSQLMFLGGADVWGVIKAWNEMAASHPKLKEELEKQGMKFLTSFGYPSTIISKKPLANPADFKGQKIRAVGPTAKWVSAMGATPVPLTFYEVTEGLARGVVDGTVGYLYVHFSYKFHDYCKYLTITPIANTLIFDIWINLDSWKKLPPDLQKIYEETWQEFFPQAVIKYTDQEIATLLKTFQEAGGKLVELNPTQYEQWKKAAAFLVDEYVKKVNSLGVDGQKLIADFEKLYQKHARKK
jgi:TRAP-type C4-dicarboxylate transport system substrate-binding protein